MRTLSFLVLLAAFFSCDDDSTNPRDIPVEETVWRLHAIELPLGTVPAAEDQELTLCLHAEAGGQHQAIVTADCNICGGPYLLGPGDAFSVTLVCTEAACPGGSQGPLLTQALNDATAYDHDDDTLRISFVLESGPGTLVFKAGAGG